MNVVAVLTEALQHYRYCRHNLLGCRCTQVARNALDAIRGTGQLCAWCGRERLQSEHFTGKDRWKERKWCCGHTIIECPDCNEHRCFTCGYAGEEKC